ncbi:MAG: hypothetical protein MUD14_20300 [Hydrococcus sp. Prado102]|jgi:hypothetical protein|nr:hypothetical protein [Hydrococcus sp. Prado102]
MANITISNLNPVGSELFFDSESYLNQLSEEEIRIQGGAADMSSPACFIITVTVTTTPWY